MNLWKDLKTGSSAPEIVYAIIEIPKGSINKYEYDKENESFILDRVLYSSVVYPAEYGIIPKTLWDDGDPMDIIVIMDQPTFSGCIIETRPIGVLQMIDDGESDYKIIGVPLNDPNYMDVENVFDLNDSFLNKIKHFFQIYKTLEGKKTEIKGWGEQKDAIRDIKRSMDLYVSSEHQKF